MNHTLKVAVAVGYKAGGSIMCKMKTTGTGLGAIALAVLLSGCGGPSGEGGVGEPPTAKTQSDIVYTLQLGERHTVDFYDWGIGAVGMQEIVPIEEADTVYARMGEGERTLADLYHMLRPDQPTPSELVRADERVMQKKTELAQLFAQHPEYLDPVTAENAVDAADLRDVAGQARGNEQESVGSAQQAVVTCSTDQFGDRWGEGWFLSNFGGIDFNVACGGGSKYKVMNWTMRFSNALTNLSNMRGAGWRDMEGDFITPGGTSADVSGLGVPDPACNTGRPCIGHQQLWSRNIPVRTVSINYTGGLSTVFKLNIFSGHQCGHGHNNLTQCVPL